MRIAILSRNRALFTSRRLVQACRKAGHSATVIDPLDLFLMVGHGTPGLFHRESNRRTSRIDLAIPRIGPALTDYGLVVIQQLESMPAAYDLRVHGQGKNPLVGIGTVKLGGPDFIDLSRRGHTDKIGREEVEQKMRSVVQFPRHRDFNNLSLPIFVF